MALDMSLFSGFSMIFMFLFVYAIFFGLLELVKQFGKISISRGLNAIIALCIAVFIAPVAAMPTASMHEKMHADEAAEQHNQYPVFQNPLHGRLSFSKHEYLSSVLSKTPPVTPHYRIFKMSCVAIGLRLSE